MFESDPDETPKQPSIPAVVDKARKINPIRRMTRGDDTYDGENKVIFSDFSPRILPADFPDQEVMVPKDVFAPAPAPSMDLAPASGQSSSVTSVQKSATSDAGKLSQSESSSQTSSS